MVRLRKLALAIAAVSALTSGTAFALGLGEIDLQSSLSQPLVAEIELLETRDLTFAEIIPKLASPEEFSKVGVDRPYFLTDLKFTPMVKANGKSVIRVTSTKSVREPYLNFLLEVLWPNGRLLREYTLLLDPPLYSPQAVTAPRIPVVATPPQQPVTASASRPAPTVPDAPERPAAPSAPAASKVAADQYKTVANDTLWEIARSARQNGSIHQAMLAIQDLNPNAFIDGNINRLKKGQILRLPSEEQIKRRRQADALAQVAKQNVAWSKGRSVAASDRQLDATRRTTAGAAPAQTDIKDNLKLVSADSGKATAGSDKGGTKVLSDQLAVAKESLDSSHRESEELKGRVADLQGQVNKLQRLIALKDSQMAKLQAELAQQNKSLAAAPSTGSAAQRSQPVESKEPQAETKLVKSKPAVSGSNDSEKSAPAVEIASPASAAQPVKPVQSEPQPEPPSFIDELLGNPMLLVTGGGVLLVLLVGLMVQSRRKAIKEAELQSQETNDSDVFSSNMGLSDDSFSGFDETADEPLLMPEPANERVAPQTTDALGEADIYIAYGKFSQAAELLHNAINDESQRTDLRLKLMEVYAELGDRNGFSRQEQDLREIGGVAGAIDQLKVKYPAMVALKAAANMAAADLDEPAAVAQPVADLDHSFDLSLDGDASFDEPATPATEKSFAMPELDSDLAFELPSAAVSPTASDMDFDLNLAGDSTSKKPAQDDELADFSLGSQAESQSAQVEDDFMLSLDDELASSGTANDFEMPVDFDLSVAEKPSASDAEDDFDFLSGTDEAATKLDLARAYIDMGDSEGARDILDEVVTEGNENQQQEARELISKLS